MSVATYVARRLVELNQVGLCSSRFTDKRSHTWKFNSKSKLKTRFLESNFIGFQAVAGWVTDW